MGLRHQRPEKRQTGEPASSSSVLTTTGRGQSASTAATMAATSAGVGVGVILSSSTSPPYSGTLPCLRFGSSSRFDRSMARPAMSFRRVSAGSMTSSM